MPKSDQQAELLSWLRTQLHAIRDLNWRFELGGMLARIRPVKGGYKTQWVSKLVRRTQRPGYASLTADEILKSLRLHQMVAKSELRRYVQAGLSWSHVVGGICAGHKLAKDEDEKLHEMRRKRANQYLTLAAARGGQFVVFVRNSQRRRNRPSLGVGPRTIWRVEAGKRI